MMNKKQHERAEDADMLAAEKLIKNYYGAFNREAHKNDVSIFLAGCRHKEAEMWGECKSGKEEFPGLDSRAPVEVSISLEELTDLRSQLASEKQKSKALAAALERIADPKDMDCVVATASEALAKYAQQEGSGG